MCIRDSRYLLDQVRGRMSFTETLDAMRGLSSKWPQTTRKLVEDKDKGTAVIDVLKKEIPGIIPVSYTHLDVYKRQAICLPAIRGERSRSLSTGKSPLW